MHSTPTTAPALPTRGGRGARTLLLIGLASATTVLGSHAAWTDQTRNAGNAVEAGTLSLTNDKNASEVFRASNVKPGDSGSGDVKLRNAGTIPMAVTLSQDAVVDGFASGSMAFNVHDASRDWCYWPTSAPGACTGYGAWDGSKVLTSLPLPSIKGSAMWAAGEEHVFTVGWKLATASPESDMGQAASFRLTWDAVQ